MSIGDYRTVALAEAQLGLADAAIANADRVVKSTESPVVLAQMASVYAISGKQKQARTMLATIEANAQKRYICGFNVACVYAALRDRNQTLEWLDRAYRDHSD